jgi:glutaminyl-peptide cyclotransferase
MNVMPRFAPASVRASAVRHLFAATLGLALAACSGQGPSRTPAPTACPDTAYRHTAAVYALGPRFSGSPGAQATIAYLQGEIAALGLAPAVDEWTEPTMVGPLVFRNLVVDVPGHRRDAFILIGCHYDTKRLATLPDFAGANDGGSGVGALLAMIQAVVTHGQPPPCTLRFAFYDGEECLREYTANDGLHGSRRHAAQLQAADALRDCLAVIVLDMIGDRDLTFTLPSGADPDLVQRLRTLAAAAGEGHRLRPYGQDILDDHTPFQRLGVPTLLLIDFEYGPGNLYWHSPGDSLDKISAASLGIAANLALALAWSLP